MIFPPHNKDCALFESTVGGKYYAFHRPSSPELGGNYIWLAESPDRLHWGDHRCIAVTREGRWDSARVGAGAAPVRTEKGWLEIYHGADGNNRYCLGALLLDLENPAKVLARSDEPIMEPTAPYEKTVFSETLSSPTDSMWKGIRYTCITGRATKSSAGPPSPSVKFWPR